MVLVSIITPVHNAARFLEEAFSSILSQTWKKSLEVSIFNDASTDNSIDLIKRWIPKFEKDGITVILRNNTNEHPGGVGYAKNKCILQSTGTYLCFLDADDIMKSERIEQQLAIAQENNYMIVGSCYDRIPEGSTKRYTLWSNNLTEDQLYKQIYTSFGPTIINPTWFCSRNVFDKGMFKEYQKGYPEDLEFFYRHLNQNGRLFKVEKNLLTYRYHESGATFSVHEDTILEMRIKELEQNVLSKWTSFTIWNAGRQGRKFYRLISKSSRSKVTAFCDIDMKKIAQKFYTCELIRDEITGKPLKVPIVHFTSAQPPYVLCMKLDFTRGEFEKNLNSLDLTEGIDFFHFN